MFYRKGARILVLGLIWSKYATPYNLTLKHLPNLLGFYLILLDIKKLKSIFFANILWLLYLASYKDGHPLPNLSGCLGTRGIRSNDAPEIEISLKQRDCDIIVNI